MDKFEELSDEEKQFYYDKAHQFLGDKDLLICTRVWEAWAIKTMDENDFFHAEDNDIIVSELAEFIYDIVKVKVRKDKIKNILDVS